MSTGGLWRQRGSWGGCTCLSPAPCREGWIQILHASPALPHPCRPMLESLGLCTHLLCPGVRAEAILRCSLVPSSASVLGLGLHSPSDRSGGAVPGAALAIMRCRRGRVRGLCQPRLSGGSGSALAAVAGTARADASLSVQHLSVASRGLF